MNISEWSIEIVGFFFIVIVGTLMHFMYDWSGRNKLVAVFAAVNESTWEHIKMALTPSFIWAIIEIPFFMGNPNFVVAKLISVITIIFTIPAIFYGYKLFTHRSVLFIDISLFVVSIGLGQWFAYLVLTGPAVSFTINYISLIILIIIFIGYMLLTLMPGRWFVFKDPINHKYGIDAHEEHSDHN